MHCEPLVVCSSAAQVRRCAPVSFPASTVPAGAGQPWPASLLLGGAPGGKTPGTLPRGAPHVRRHPSPRWHGSPAGDAGWLTRAPAPLSRGTTQEHVPGDHAVLGGGGPRLRLIPGHTRGPGAGRRAVQGEAAAPRGCLLPRLQGGTARRGGCRLASWLRVPARAAHRNRSIRALRPAHALTGGADALSWVPHARGCCTLPRSAGNHLASHLITRQQAGPFELDPLALLLIALLTGLLAKGTRESALFNLGKHGRPAPRRPPCTSLWWLLMSPASSLFWAGRTPSPHRTLSLPRPAVVVCCNLSVIAFILLAGFPLAHPANLSPFLPFGATGMFSAARCARGTNNAAGTVAVAVTDSFSVLLCIVAGFRRWFYGIRCTRCPA